MGLTAPEQVSTVRWTRFLAADLPTDWTDQKAAHRAIMAMFPRDLPGDPAARRAAHGILYRLDNLGGQAVVLVQSAIAPVLLPPAAQTMTVPEHAWRFAPGDRVAFRVAVNPVKRIGKVDPRLTAEDRATRTLVADGKAREVGIGFDEVPGWVAAKVADALTDIEVLDQYRDTTKGGRHRLTVDTLDCLATVVDTDRFDALRRDGVGRAKAYGCGLLTARRAMHA